MSQFAFVFPGQGSQSTGMMSALAEEFTLVKDLFDEASTHLGYDLWQVVTEEGNQQLNETEYTQPALLVAGVATYRVWQQISSQVPSVMAGHSLGEYTALVCAESLAFADAVKLVSARGKYMQQAVPAGTGAMAAIIGFDDEKVVALCNEISGVVTPANFNSTGQVVIAGEHQAVLDAVAAAKEQGAKLAKQIPVSVPSHCELMKPAAEQLAALLNGIALAEPKIDVINNVNAVAEQDVETIKQSLVKQLYSPVRWVESVQKISEVGVSKIGECGPGKVLSGLIKRIDRSITVTPFGQLSAMQEFSEQVQV